MRIETNGRPLIGAGHVEAEAEDDYIITVTVTGLDPNGDPQTVILKLTRNEITTISNTATRKRVRR